MSGVEARTREALPDVVDGLAVTDDDVARMESELLTAVGSPRLLGRPSAAAPTRRVWGLAAAAVAMVAAVVAGLALSTDDGGPPRPAGEPRSDQPLVPDDVVGLWRQVPNSPFLWEIARDGRIGWTRSPNDYVNGEPLHTTITRRVGDVFTFASEAVPKCIGDHRIALTSPTTAVVTVQNDTCDVPRGHTLRLVRTTPGPLTGEVTTPLVAPGATSTVVLTEELRGSWLHAETGTMLIVGGPSVGTSLRYLMDDDGDGATDPDHDGFLTLRSDGSVDARPFASSTPGCSLRFTAVVTDRSTITTTSGPGGCLAAGSRQTWIKLN